MHNVHECRGDTNSICFGSRTHFIYCFFVFKCDEHFLSLFRVFIYLRRRRWIWVMMTRNGNGYATDWIICIDISKWLMAVHTRHGTNAQMHWAEILVRLPEKLVSKFNWINDARVGFRYSIKVLRWQPIPAARHLPIYSNMHDSRENLNRNKTKKSLSQPSSLVHAFS